MIAIHNIAKWHAPSSFPNKENFVFHGGLAMTQKLWPLCFENCNMCIFKPWPYHSHAQGEGTWGLAMPFTNCAYTIN